MSAPSIATSWGQGRYLAGEGELFITSRIHRLGETGRLGIIALHGRGANGLTWSPGWSGGDHVAELANDFIILSPDAGGTLTWGNNTAMSAIDAAYTYLRGTLGANGSTKIGLMGWSMGGLNALNWLKRNPEKVACTWLWSPMTNLGAAQAGAYTAEINTAYSGNYATNSVGHDPIVDAADYQGLGRIHLCHATNDSTINVTQSRDWVAAVNDPNVDLAETNTGGHTGLFTSWPTVDTLTYFREGAW